MLGCAEQILETFQREGFLDRVPEGYRLVFTGHSMGAGVASICSLLFRRKFRDRVKPDSAVGEREGESEPPEDAVVDGDAALMRKEEHEQELCEVDPPADEADRRIPMSAVLLCPPGWTMSPKLAAETRAFSVTIVTSYDNIPRSRPDTLIRFREHMCYLLERVRLSKWKIFLINRYQCCRRRYEPQVEELCEYGPGSSDGKWAPSFALLSGRPIAIPLALAPFVPYHFHLAPNGSTAPTRNPPPPATLGRFRAA
eukprot:g8700.t1